MSNRELEDLRTELDQLNLQILDLINQRATIVQQIGQIKQRQGVQRFDPTREREMLNKLKAANHGPFCDATIQHIFKEIFKASLDLQKEECEKQLLVSRKRKAEDTVIQVKDLIIGGKNPVLIAGPCSVESDEQLEIVAKALQGYGLHAMRGGAFKPRTSPYDFQGLGFPGIKMLKAAGEKHGLAVISEIVDPAYMEEAAQYLDMIQIGARNMQNFELLKVAGKVDVPILLKRGMSATIEELLYAAEYILSNGNHRVILCERGIRTYEKWTRNTLDISAVPLLKQESHLPVLVDVTHATGRRDILLPCAKAALAAGADGVMIEVHPDPNVALSDAMQQIDLAQLDQFIQGMHDQLSIMGKQLL
ncbi:bifunctional 3-deoxy-7-phosphoheptulonate synthase/chorismate mutase [Rubeoparvulum massiliense]|uniref:bifunctional 3-deoxy-7-phosphoheptulonate synthase/chorismate mutase n=1 Tax=Rubeoparvulum massiliense TaxID=1631346 RepID=UPI00065E4B3E|nr:bifunctional 3-deoxy-7-phosphoheptulonate synthase/chorismate mutase [Rubeoparvulum massiliense]